MSGHNKSGIDQSASIQNDRGVVSLQEWRVNRAAGSTCAPAGDADTTSAPSTSPRRFDPAMMPEPSANQKRFMEIMSGDESDPAFAVGVVLFFWRFSRRGMPMPKRALALLERHAATGDPACILVRDWLGKRMVKTGKRLLWVFEGGKA